MYYMTNKIFSNISCLKRTDIFCYIGILPWSCGQCFWYIALVVRANKPLKKMGKKCSNFVSGPQFFFTPV